VNQPEVFVYKNKEGEEYVLQEHCDYDFHEDGEKFLETIWILTRGEANRAQSVQQGTISPTKGNDTRKTNASPTLPKTQ